MPTLADLLDGVVPAPLHAHLSQQPIVEPVTLAGLVEASWPGYAFSPVQFQQRVFFPMGLGFVKGVACFAVDPAQPPPVAAVLYLTSQVGPTIYLVWVANLVGTAFAQLAHGPNYFQFAIQSFVIPVGL